MPLVEMHMSSIVSGPWSCSLPAVRTANCCMENPRTPPEPAESSPLPLLWPSPKTHPQTAGASSPSTSPSSLGAKLLTWPPSAAPPMAMQACTPPCPPSARPAWTSTNCTCRVPSRARSPTRERTRRTRWRMPQCPSKVIQRKGTVLTSSSRCRLIYSNYVTDLSVREESDNDPNQSDDADPEASPTKSPTTPKNVKCKNSSGTL